MANKRGGIAIRVVAATRRDGCAQWSCVLVSGSGFCPNVSELLYTLWSAGMNVTVHADWMMENMLSLWW